jgi:ATP-dependent DNA ligase
MHAHGRLRGRRLRYASKGGVVGSLLLGLFDEAGALHHVGFTSAIPGDKAELTKRLKA